MNRSPNMVQPFWKIARWVTTKLSRHVDHSQHCCLHVFMQDNHRATQRPWCSCCSSSVCNRPDWKQYKHASHVSGRIGKSPTAVIYLAIKRNELLRERDTTVWRNLKGILADVKNQTRRLHTSGDKSNWWLAEPGCRRRELWKGTGELLGLLNCFYLLVVWIDVRANTCIKAQQSVHWKSVSHVSDSSLGLSCKSCQLPSDHISFNLGLSKPEDVCQVEDLRLGGQLVSPYQLFWMLESGVFLKFLTPMDALNWTAAVFVFLFLIFPILKLEPEDVMRATEDWPPLKCVISNVVSGVDRSREVEQERDLS